MLTNKNTDTNFVLILMWSMIIKNRKKPIKTFIELDLSPVIKMPTKKIVNIKKDKNFEELLYFNLDKI